MLFIFSLILFLNGDLLKAADIDPKKGASAKMCILYNFKTQY